MYLRRWELEQEAALQDLEEMQDPGGKVVANFDQCEFCLGSGEDWGGIEDCRWCKGDGLKRLEMNPPPNK